MAEIKITAPPIQFENRNQTGTQTEISVDVASLESELRRTIRGEVRFDAAGRALYSMDASSYRQVPIGVVLPIDADDVVAAVAAARKHGAPIVARGGGTSIPGQSVNVALMFDFSKYMNRILEIDVENRIARVEPGVVLDTMRDETSKYGLTFGPDPATHNRCTLGGMAGNNSCGIHSVTAGRTVDNIEEMDILTYDGDRMRVGMTNESDFSNLHGRQAEIYANLRAIRDKYGELIRERFPKIPRRVSGYCLDELLPENNFNVARSLVGSECTCVLFLEIAVRLVPIPPVRCIVVIAFPDVYEAGDFVATALQSNPIGLEGMDDSFVEDMRRKGRNPEHIEMLPQGRAWLFVEFGGDTQEECDANASQLARLIRTNPKPTNFRIFKEHQEQKLLWDFREEGLGATAKVPGKKENWEGWEDAAVSPQRLGDYLRDFHALLKKYGYSGPLYGHFGDGCVHTRLDFDLETTEGIANYRSFVEEGADLVVQYGGSLSGEHGDGQARGELLSRMYGVELIQAFEEFKRAWDPQWKMNPGKLIAPNKLDEDIKVAPPFDPPQLNTNFSFHQDKYSFTQAALRCVGAGVCRRKSGGTMCPSYMATLEEKHSTRGRSRLLFEMMLGDTVRGGWKNEGVKEALDLCLACKACKAECPVQVDMATYKAEFLSHYYRGRLRPRHAYVFGLIPVWSRIASVFPSVTNFITQTAFFAPAAKLIMGVDKRRRLPKYSPYTFRDWFRLRKEKNTHGIEVILWPDTFNNHFHPETAAAAVELLESAGYRVSVPKQTICCGRPLYDYGFLGIAKKWLCDILDALHEPIQQGTPIIVLEPSCASVFREELLNFFPEDELAKRLSKQIFLLSEFLRAHDYKPKELNAAALVHGHCHHKSVMKMRDEEALLSDIGMRFQTLDSGCCGMAGAFGFEAGEHYDVSIKCGERALLPAVREARAETIIIADGFSCREQIFQQTGRHALHLAEVLRLADDEEDYAAILARSANSK